MRIPAGHQPERASGSIVAVNWPTGIQLYRDFGGELPPVYRARLAGWLEGWVFRQGKRVEGMTAAYLLLQMGAAGTHDGRGGDHLPFPVIGVGYGSDPVAPDDSEEVELSVLVAETVTLLLAGQLTEVHEGQDLPW
ncbi:hypothetical protein GCM10009839_91930 [Catenulispora yoronensis]|uniref:Uncharacterized protein n=1 Tax=Catenulispora yoronensis TaxID=450799 RepID=A0ABP5H9B0_9ACTN